MNGTYTPIVGDFGGDELDDIFWYGPGTKPDVLWISIASHTFESKPVTVNGTFTPEVLDDTLGKDDIVYRHASVAVPARSGRSRPTPPT